MTHYVLINLAYVVAICTTLTVFLLFPGVSLEIWTLPLKKWTTYKVKRLARRRKHAEDKLKKYWEIDMTKLR